jgi:hypothetical protein
VLTVRYMLGQDVTGAVVKGLIILQSAFMWSGDTKEVKSSSDIPRPGKEPRVEVAQLV